MISYEIELKGFVAVLTKNVSFAYCPTCFVGGHAIWKRNIGRINSLITRQLTVDFRRVELYDRGSLRAPTNDRVMQTTKTGELPGALKLPKGSIQRLLEPTGVSLLLNFNADHEKTAAKDV